jgi:hypothetical protein
MQNSAKAGEAMRHCKREAARSSRVTALGVLGICEKEECSFNHFLAQ